MRLTVFGDLEVVFGQIGDERAVFVFHIEEKLHHVDAHLQGLCRLLRVFRLLILAFLILAFLIL